MVDGVNVGYEVYRIRTRIGEGGSTVQGGYTIPVRDKKTRAERYQTLDADLVYTKRDLDRSVVAPNQIAADTSVAEETAPALRQSILRAAFGGRLVEQDPRDEPADVLLARLHQSAPQPIPASSRRVRRARSHAAGAEP